MYIFIRNAFLVIVGIVMCSLLAAGLVMHYNANADLPADYQNNNRSVNGVWR